MRKRQLTELQERFLKELLNCNGNITEACKRAGYSENTDPHLIAKSLKDEIIELTKDYLSTNGVKAALSLTSVLDDPTAMGNREKIKAATELLDRVGVYKTEKVEHSGLENSVVLLPPKNARTDKEAD